MARGRFTVFILSGRIETQAIAELRRLVERRMNYCDIVASHCRSNRNQMSGEAYAIDFHFYP